MRRRLLVITIGAVAVHPGEVPEPATHMLTGIVSTLRRELADVDVRLVDLDPDADQRRWGTVVANAAEYEIAWSLAAHRGDSWYEPIWQPEPAGEPTQPRLDGVFLVTGGLGALGSASCAWLAARGAAHLHVVTRRPVPDRATWAGDTRLAGLANLEASGCTVTVHQADVADPYAMTALVGEIRSLRGRISGVVHAAGTVVDDRAVARFDLAGFGTRLRAKVDGARILDELFDCEDLDLFLFYGSAITYVGNAGQAEYAAANAFLDALAAARRARGLAGLCVAWSTWAGPGVASTHDFQRRSAELGLPPLDPQDALAVLDGVLRSSASTVCVAKGEPGAVLASDPADADLDRVDAPQVRRVAPRPAHHDVDRVLSVVSGVLCRQLGEREVDLDANLFDLGASSLDLTEIVAAANRELAIDASPTVVFAAPTGRRLAARLAEELRARTTIKEPVSRETRAEAVRPTDIAVIGLACRFPGAATPEELWELLLEGRTTMRPVAPGALTGEQGARWTASLLAEPYGFDPLTFRISPAEAPWLDPQQRLALELAWEALERAGHAGHEQPATGVFIGAEPTRYHDKTPAGRYSAVGGANTTSLVANRINYALRLGGPSLVCDTACSSSGVAVHLARMSLLAGECDLAIAGGVKLLLDQRGFEVNAAAGLLSQTGGLHAFGANADGYVRGEGGAILVLRRLSEALSDGDEILAVLTASGTAHDAGDKVGLTAPSPNAQHRLLSRVWRDAGVTRERLAFVEAHGTGTVLGDRTELEAIEAALRERPGTGRPWLGTIKANVGHTEAAAAAAGLAKAVLSLSAGVVPTHPVARRPSAAAARPDSPLRLPNAAVPITEDRAQAAVSAFGFGGANAHLVLEQAPSVPPASARQGLCHVVPVSARTTSAFEQVCHRLADRLAEDDHVDLAGVARTLAVGRFHQAVRRAFVVADRVELVRRLRAAKAPEQTDRAGGVLVKFGHLRPPAVEEMRDLLELAPARDAVARYTAGKDPHVWLTEQWSQMPEDDALSVTKSAVLAVLGTLRGVRLAVPDEQELLDHLGLARLPTAQGTTLEVELAGDQAPRAQTINAVAAAYESHVDVAWERLWADSPVRRVTLPTYPFERQVFRPEPTGLAVPAEPAPPNGTTQQWTVALPTWVPYALSAGVLAGTSWRVLGHDDALTAALAERLRAAAAEVRTSWDVHRVLWLLPSPTGSADPVWADVLDTCRALGGLTRTVRVVAVCPADPTGAPDPAGAAVAGLLRGLADEASHVELATLRVSNDESALSELASRVVGVLGGLGSHGEFRLTGRDGTLTRRSLRPAAVTEERRVPGVGGVVLVTGGAGGVGRHLVDSYLAAGARHVVIFGRHATPDESADPRLRVAAVDVTDRAQLKRAIENVRRELGHISAVVHAAGTFDHERRSLRGKTTESVASVLAPKTDGAPLLAELLAEDPPELLVLCSSICATGAGLAGGQADYAAANAFLDAHAEVRRSGPTQMLSIGWPQWAGVGMSTGRSLPAAARAVGLGELDPAVGAAAFLAVLRGGLRGAVTLLCTTGNVAEVLERLDAHHDPAADSGDGRPDLVGVVRRTLAGLLGLDDSAMDDEMSFVDLGLDSLGVADLAGALEAELSTVVDPANVLLNPTVRALATHLATSAGRGPASVRPTGAGAPNPDPPPARPTRVATPAADPVESPEPAGSPPPPWPDRRPRGQTPIAVIGMAGRFPGAESVAELWELLRAGRDATGLVPASRWDWQDNFDPSDSAGGSVSKWGGFLDEPGSFDHEHFGLNRAHAALLDPLQRLFLEIAWSALRDAGAITGQTVSATTGVFVGARATGASPADVPTELGREAAVGYAQNFVAARVAQHLDLRGPALVVDTACSSSLVAVHLAAQSLATGESELAVAGGVDLLAGPATYTSLSAAGALSRRGRCATFSADADGYVPGEGAAAVVLKPLDAALASGDRVYAVLLGSAVNNDGRTIGLTTPSVEAQRAVLRAAYDRAGLEPATVGLVEAHGTGTPIGDPIEVRALADVLGQGAAGTADVVLGSIKTNIGHLHSAAGIASLTKAVLCLHHRTRVPSLHAVPPNPRLNLDATPFRLLDHAEAWPDQGPRRAGVSAFGFGGTNCHVVLAEAPARTIGADTSDTGLLMVSARTAAALRRTAADLAAWSDNEESNKLLAAWSPALSDGRGAFSFRAALRGTSAALHEQLRAVAEGQPAPSPIQENPRPVLMFPGQGAQHPGIARELRGLGVFAEAIEECASWLDPHLDTTLREMVATTDEELMNKTAVTQPVLFAVEYALDRLWRGMGVRPFAVIGHSVGEFAAMVSAGVLAGPDAGFLVAHRARLMAACEPGAMISVSASERDLADVLAVPGGVEVAAVNGPESVVLSGRHDQIAAATASLRASGVPVLPVRVSHAYHSRMMLPAARELAKLARSVRFSEPTEAIFVSTADGAVRTSVDADYIGQQVLRPVRFADAVGAARRAGGSMFLEVGPGRTLGMLTRAVLGDGVPIAGGLDRRGPDREALLDAAGKLWMHGVDVRVRPLFPAVPALPPLPPYPFERVNLGLLPAADASGAETGPARGYLETVRSGADLCVGTRMFRAGDSVMDDHTVRGRRVLPGVSWLTMVVECLAGHGVGPVGTFRDITFVRPLSVADRAVKATVEVTRGGDAWLFTGYSDTGTGRTVHARGRFESGATGLGTLDLAEQWARGDRELDEDELYRRIRGQGIVHGPFYRCLRRARADAGSAVGELALPAGADTLPLHPALLDGATTVGAALPDHAPWVAGRAYVPFHIESLAVAAALPARAVCHYRMSALDGELAVFDFDICAPDGQVCVSATRFASKRVPDVWSPDELGQSLLGRLRWTPAAVFVDTGRPA